MSHVRANRAKLRTFSRYTAASVVAVVVSELAFLSSYALGALPVVASVLAWAAGAIPNYFLNRRWAWQRRGRADRKRELLPYVAIVLVTAGAAAAMTTAADAYLTAHLGSRTWQVLLVGGTYLATYGIMFLLKFVLFDRFVFAGSSSGAAPACTHAATSQA